MSTLVKILVSLGLVLPLGAFVAGSVVASGADEPGPRETIVIRDSPARSPAGSTAPHDHRTPPATPRGDDHAGPEVVTPSLDDLGDDHGGHGGHGSGHGGHGSDDRSGPGSSHGSGDDSGGSHGSDDSGGGGHG